MDAGIDVDRARQLIRRLSPLAADRIELLGAGTRAGIPFLLTVRWLQDALHVIGRGGEPRLDRLHEHLAAAHSSRASSDAGRLQQTRTRPSGGGSSGSSS
jgi:hypothetical protein